MSADLNELAYIGRTTAPTPAYPAGSVVAVVFDDPNRKKQTGYLIRQWVIDGLAIERVPNWWVRLHFGTTDVYRAGDLPPEGGV